MGSRVLGLSSCSTWTLQWHWGGFSGPEACGILVPQPAIETENSESESCSVMFDSLWPHGLYSSWNSPGQNTGVGSLSLLQGIFPTQELNPGLLCCRQILYQLSHKDSPRILEWIAYPFSSGSSRPRNQPWVSCIAGGFFTNWAMREDCWTWVPCIGRWILTTGPPERPLK